MPLIDKRTIQRIRVPAGFLFAIVFIVFSRPTLTTIAIGAAIAFIGLLVRAWASGHIRKAQTLATSGPYAYTRNPLYLGSLLMAIGFTVAGGVWWLVILSTVLFLGIYLPVMRVEADDMRRIFGSEYEAYAARVPMLFPGFGRVPASTERFDFQLYLQYREYRAAIGVLTALALLAAKAYFGY